MTMKFKFCLTAVATLHADDLDAVTAKIEAYRAAGMSDQMSERAAVDDVIAQGEGEFGDIGKLLREQHPDLFMAGSIPVQSPSIPVQSGAPGAPKPSANTVFTEDAAAAARARLKAKLGRLSSGLDPETMMDGITLAGYHIEKGARTFAAYARAMVDDLGDAVKPYLKSWYMAVSFDPRAAGMQPDMTGPGEVAALDVEQVLAAAEGSGAASLAEFLGTKIAAGDMPKDNPALRKLVEAYDGKPADNARLKQAQEALEAAIVVASRSIIAQRRADGTRATFDALVALYGSQPNLNIRTSTSIANQAYSTPAPLAFLSSILAGITRASTVYEPTAGTGMLAIGADPARVQANEINPERQALLVGQGFDVTRRDATEAGVAQSKSKDRVITNPPFGPIKDAAGASIKVKVDGYTMGQIDHLIAARALEAMKDDGAATLIIGANKATGRQSNNDLVFFNWLYSHYNVTSHFEVDGDLYARQGAGWPVRVITINGRQASSRTAPDASTIERATTWEQVYERFEQGLAAGRGAAGDRVGPVGARPGATDDARPVPRDAGGEVGRADPVRPQGSAAGDGDVAGAGPGVVGDRGAVPAQPVGERAPAQRQDGRAAGPADVAGQAGASAAAKPAGSAGTAGVAQDNQFQATYVARSARKDEGVLIPVNMAGPTQDALNRLEDEVGDIDEFARKELGYESVAQLHKALMGLQVDSAASAIRQIKAGKGVIIADQTGIGKGRQAASVIRWALKNGKVPIFITVKPSLFTDMFGDLHDIGSDDVAPLLLNSDASIKGEGDERLFANRPGAHRRTLEGIAATGSLPTGSNALFMTYSQINVDNIQRRAVMALADKAVFILDESHNAGGDSSTGNFIRGALDVASGVTYLSATYAKRPDNMPVYFKTDIGDAVADDETLMAAMSAGGLPLQTVVANNLVKAGQMFRRERSYDGVSIESRADTAHRAEHVVLSDATTKALRAIVSADRMFHENFVKAMQKELEKEGARVLDVAGNQVKASVDHTEFSSVVHNFVRQMLLGLKAQEAADDAIRSIKRGEKPLIAVENTMGSFLAEYAENNSLKVGDPLGMFDYRTVLSRALERSRYIVRQLPNGDKVKEYIPLAALDPVSRQAYDSAQAIIDALNINIPVSPIDWMRNEITKAGYTVAEVTGRNLSVDYSDPKVPRLSQIEAAEQKDKVRTTRLFNAGRLNALVLNVAGSTGISLHASEKFIDQRQRHMIVAQAAQDINIFMQMLGRIHRTGQVRLPKYTILSADLPAEIRPTALLSAKMKSLNANTSSNTESATSVKAADMLNKYGDQIVGQYLADNLPLARQLGVSLPGDGEEASDDIARRATGRLALMPVEVQEQFYAEVEEQYRALLDYLNKTNQNDLEPRTFDFDAAETSSALLFEGKDKASPFGEDAFYGEYSIKAQGKPMAPAEIKAVIDENLGGKTSEEHMAALVTPLLRAFTAMRATLDEDQQSAADATMRSTTGFLEAHPIGSMFRVDINGDHYNAVVTNIRSTHKAAGNPYSLSKVQVTLALNGSLRSVTVPGTQFRGIETSTLPRMSVESAFREGPTNERETAKIVTGNLLGAYGELQGVRGSIITFTKQDGTTEQGILLPKAFNFTKDVRQDYRLRTADDAHKFLTMGTSTDLGRFGINSRDNVVRVLPAGREGVTVQVPKSKARGGKFFLDAALRAVTGDFTSIGNFMRATVDTKDQAIKALGVLMRKQALYALPSMAEDARRIVGDTDSAERSEGKDGETQFSRAESTGPWYSALERAVASLGMNAAPAQGWQAMLKGMVSRGAIKADELEWTGVTEWLDLQSGKITKAQVIEFLNANGVMVTETVLGADGSHNDAPEWGALNDEHPQGTKYSQYTLPGGTNYREVLLTLPSRPETVDLPAGRGPYEARQSSGQWYIVDRTGEWGDQGYPTKAEAEAAFPAATTIRVTRDPGELYRSGHWDQPNVLAHIRLNDRTDASGARVLFVEEVQSDWAQQAKKQGFRDPAKSPWDVFVSKGYGVVDQGGYWQVLDYNGDPVSEGNTKDEAIQDLVTRDGEATPGGGPMNEAGLPRAPFVGKTDAWVSLALKRVIKMAVDEGYDRVAFVTGDQSAERYDLSKQISAINYEPFDGDNGQRLYEIEAIDLNDNKVFAEDEVTIERVEELVGKDIAKKIAAEEGKAKGNQGGYRNWHRLSGLDLKVGGEGMKAFYDKIVPSVAKDVLRKLGGGPIGQVAVQGESKYEKQFKSAAEAEAWAEANLGDHSYRVYGASSASKTFAIYDEFTNRPVPDVAQLSQPGFDITPAMKEKAAGGMPMFSIARRNLLIGAAAAAANAEAGTTLGKAKPIPAALLTADLPANIQKLLRGNGATTLRGAEVLGQALRELAATGPAELRALAAQIAGLLPTSGVMLTVDDRRTVNAHGAVSHNVGGPHMMLFTAGGRKGLTAGTFLHEALHVAVLARYKSLSSGLSRSNDALFKMSAPQAAAQLEQFRALWREFGTMAKEQISKITDPALRLSIEEAHDSPDEFFVRALTDEKLQAWMAGVEYQGKSLLQRFKDWVVGLFVKDGVRPSWLDAALLASNELAAAMPADKADFARMRASAALREEGADSKSTMPGKATETLAFRQWFGASKIVDAAGQPRVMYHGTGQDITAFKPKQAGAIFLTDEPYFAEQYANTSTKWMEHRGEDGAANILPLYVKAENPFDYENPQQVQAVIAKALELHGRPLGDGQMAIFDPEFKTQTLSSAPVLEYGMLAGDNWSLLESQHIQDAIKALGHDAFYVNEGGFKNLGVYSPSQVKSATGNRGTFDGSSEDIWLQRVWHGTPHKVDRFSTDFIGTGEGNQAYGYGLYFAGKKEVADYYRKALSGDGSRTYTKDGKTLEATVDLMEAYYKPGRLVRGYSGTDKVLEFKITDGGVWMVQVIGTGPGGQPLRTERPRWHRTQPDAPTLKSVLEEDGWKASKPGNLYAVEIPEDNEMLLWDRPLSEHPAKVRDALAPFIARYAESQRQIMSGFSAADVEREIQVSQRTITGQGIYEQAGYMEGGDRGASEYLLGLGVRGIKYLDGTSRGTAGKPSLMIDGTVKQPSMSQPAAERSGDVRLLRSNGNVQSAIAEAKETEAPADEVAYLESLLARKVSVQRDGESHNYVIFSGDDTAILGDGLNDPDTFYSRIHTPEQLAALAKAGQRPARTMRQSIAAGWQNMTATLANRGEMGHEAIQNTLDQFHGIDRAVKRDVGDLDHNADPYITARLANGGVGSVMRALLLHGQAEWSANGQHLQKKDGTVGLLTILDPLKNDLPDWFGWMAGNRAARLKREGKENNFTDDDIRELKGLAGTPERERLFKDVARQYAEFKRSVLDIGEAAGIIDATTRPVWDHADYIPFFRLVDEKATFSPTGKKGLAGQSSGIRQLRGGAAALNDPIENLLMGFSRIIDASLKNNALDKTLAALEGASSPAIERTGYDMKPALVLKSGIKQQLLDAGTDPMLVDLIPDDAFDGIAKMWSIQAPTDKDVIRVMRDGKPVYFRVLDPLLLKAATSFVPFDMPGLGLARLAKRVLTGAVTATPDFMIRNWVRDSLSVLGIARDRVMPWQSVQGVWTAMRETGGAEAMMFAGASFQGGNIGGHDPTTSARAIRRALRQKGLDASATDSFMRSLVDKPARAWDLYRKIGEAVENSNREAVYEATMGRSGNATSAAFEAKDLMDFSLRGSHPIYQVAADVLPFFNARVQGLYRLGRADPVRLAAYGGIVATLSVLLWAANSGEPWYERLEDWDKDGYWHFRVRGEHFRIPKPFEVGAIFGTIPERIFRFATGRDSATKFGHRLLAVLHDQLAFDPVPQLVRPAANVWANKDTFRDRPIETIGDDKQLPHMRFSGTTSATMRTATRELADLGIDLSPKKLEYLMGGYLGTSGLYALGLSDMAVRAIEGYPPRPTMRTDELPVVRSFYQQDPARSTVFESDLYKLREKADEAFTSMRKAAKAGDAANVQRLMKLHEKQIQAAPTLDAVAAALAKFNQQRDAIYADRTATPDQKRQALDRLQEQRNELTRRAMQSPGLQSLQ